VAHEGAAVVLVEEGLAEADYAVAHWINNNVELLANWILTFFYIWSS
jgi:hypothetical protein